MMTIAGPRQRAFAVWWHEMDRWVVPASVIMRGALPRGWTTARIGDLVQLLMDRIEVDPEREYKMAGVKWYGEGVFHRETVRGDKMSAHYVAPLKPGALIYNRLFAWKASFAVVPQDLADCFVSNEFPQFIADSAKLLAQYLYLFCNSPQTIRAVNAASTGSAAVSRNRFREEFFLQFEMPLPPLEVQRAIVAAWEQAQQGIADTRLRITELEHKIEADFLAALGLSKPEHAMLPKVLAVWWKDFGRWSVTFNQRVQTNVDLSAGQYPLVALGECLASMQYGTSEKANQLGRGVPVLRINNIKGGYVDTSDLKHVDLPVKTKESLLLRDGDILVIRTSGSRDLVGTCAVFHEQGQYVFASYLIRMSVNPTQADPDYIGLFINSSLGRQQVDAISRHIMQNNINSEELRSIQIPLGPLSVQRKLIAKVDAEHQRIAVWKAEAAQKTEQARADIEAMILGEKKVQGE